MFENLFSRVGSALSPPIDTQVTPCYVVGNNDPSLEEDGRLPEVSELGGYDGVLITGSKYDAHGDNLWILKLMEWIQGLSAFITPRVNMYIANSTTEAWKTHPRLRFSGVCFGHQILSRSLGARISPNPRSWELAHTQINLTSIGRRLFSTGDSKCISLHQMHQDCVISPPNYKTAQGLLRRGEEVHVWGESKDCSVQGLYIPGRVFTSQGHLGYDEGMIRMNIEHRQESGFVDERRAEEAKERAEMEHDGEVVAGAILKFFVGRDDGVK